MNDMDDLRGNARSSSEQVDRFLEDLGGSDEPKVPNASGPSAAADAGSGSAGKRRDFTSDVETGARNTMNEATEKGREVADSAKEKAAEFTDTFQAKADEGLDSAASGLGQAAEKLREQGEQREGTAATAATRAADALDSAGNYLRDKDTDQLLSDLEGLVRRKPAESLLAAAGIGFVLSKLLR